MLNLIGLHNTCMISDSNDHAMFHAIIVMLLFHLFLLLYTLEEYNCKFDAV